MTIFWDVAPCSLTETEDVSEVFTAYTIRTMSEISVSHGGEYEDDCLLGALP
jgi:hypothetical protein